MQPVLTQKELKDQLKYHMETGLFYWIKPKAGRQVHRPVGTLNKNCYLVVAIDYKNYYLHRLAWLYMTGEFPEIIDHMNTNKSDNRFSNLRLATIKQNAGNSKKHKDNVCGYKGVTEDKRNPNKKRYIASIKVGKKRKHLGVFENAPDAHHAYLRKAKELYGEFARGV